MRYIRSMAAAATLISAVVCGTQLWAKPQWLMTDQEKKQIRAECQRVFDRDLHDCLLRPGSTATGADCTEIAGQSWARCMSDHGMDVRVERPPRITYRPAGSRPQVAPATPKPSKRKDIDSGSATTGRPSVAPPTATPSKRKTIDAGSSMPVGAARSPTPSPFGSPKPVPKTKDAPSPKER